MSSVEAWLASQTARRFFDNVATVADALKRVAQVADRYTVEQTYEKPRYKHEAPSSAAFLGQWQNYDLYYMPLKNGTDVYLARYGDHPNDVRDSQLMAGPTQHGAPGGWIIALKIAQFIATELELQKPRTRKAILNGEQSER